MMHSIMMSYYWKKFTAISLTVILIFIAFQSPGVGNDLSDDTSSIDFSYLKQRLIDDGVDSLTLKSFFENSEFTVIPELLKINIIQPSGKAGYKRFVSSESVEETVKFLRENREKFEKVLEKTNVDHEVAASILMVESNLGLNKGKYSIFNVYASLTLLSNDQLEKAAPDFWEKSLENVPDSERVDGRDTVLKKAHQKAKWAYKELFALIEMSSDSLWKMDPLQIKGSWAGAYGIPQFIPTSVKAYGKDGDGDGIIDIENLDDAIASVANYLSIHGYSAADPLKGRKAVWHYNHSDEYVDCIIELRDKVKLQFK